MSDGKYPPIPIKGWLQRGPDFGQGWNGWQVFAEPKPGRVPVTIVAGHAKRPSREEVNDD